MELDYPAVFVACSFSTQRRCNCLKRHWKWLTFDQLEIGNKAKPPQPSSSPGPTGGKARFLSILCMFDIYVLTSDDAYGEGFYCYRQSWCLAVALEFSDCLALSAAPNV
jgi:hypothetical protein